MLAEAKRNAGPWQEAIDFRLMDAQKPTFTAESFDVVLSRNLTWVLEDPEQTYGNWRHVLKPGGLLLNFDANWYNYLYLSLIHISEPTRLGMISYAVFCLKKKKKNKTDYH